VGQISKQEIQPDAQQTTIVEEEKDYRKFPASRLSSYDHMSSLNIKVIYEMHQTAEGSVLGNLT
jgi:hypothetical protein